MCKNRSDLRLVRWAVQIARGCLIIQVRGFAVAGTSRLRVSVIWDAQIQIEYLLGF